MTRSETRAAPKLDAATFYFHDWLVEAMLEGRSPESQKLWLVSAYTQCWISAPQCAAFMMAYGLDAD